MCKKISRCLYKIYMVGVISLMMCGCSISRQLSEDEYLIDKVKVISEENPAVAQSLKPKVKQQANTRILGFFRWPLRVYCLSGKGEGYINRTLRKIGEAPRLYNDELAGRSCGMLTQSLVNQGYLRAEVSADTVVRKRRKAQLNYYVHPDILYRIGEVQYLCADTALLSVIYADTVHSLLKVGMPMDASRLNEERTRLAEYLSSKGYYGFTKDYITYVADTARNSSTVGVSMRIRSRQVVRGEDGTRHVVPYTPYRIGNLTYMMYPVSYNYQRDFAFTDTLHRDGASYYFNSELLLRPQVLGHASMFVPGALYDGGKVKESHASFGRLAALKYTNILFTETSDSTLDCNVVLYPAKKISTSAELDLTNTSGDFGVSAALSFTDRNLFRGAEVFTLKLRGAYENITHLADYASSHYIEYGADMSLNFPRFIVPFVSNEIQRRSKATTQLELQYNAQTRPEFDRNVLSASWSYLWNSNSRVRHRFDLLGVNLVSVPRKDQFFIDNYLNQYNRRNSIMKFNYEDLFIFRTGYDFYYTSPDAGVSKDYFDVSHSVRASVEASGNMLYMLSHAFHMPQDTLGQYRLFGIAYAQYVKNDMAWTMNVNFDHRHALLFHIEAGVAFPYGNARMLPFEKRYYAGGANSVRGWSVRGLGPGSYVSPGGTIDYINQSGDIKLDLSMEYRTHLFWKFNGAFFVDAGNIWTIYDYSDQPNGQFGWNDFYKQIAVAYGAGLRLDLNFLVLRFDVGMKAINPAYREGPLRYPIVNPKFGRDFAWHFAVGYPF